MTPEPTPWFSKYRTEFLESLRFNEAELLDHPVACTRVAALRYEKHAQTICWEIAGIVAIASSDANPVALVDSLRGVRSLPRLFKRGVYDSNIYR